jgi:hypothetical protein
MTIPDTLLNAVNRRLEHPICESAHHRNTAKPIISTGESVARGVAAIYRRLPSFAVIYHCLIPKHAHSPFFWLLFIFMQSTNLVRLALLSRNTAPDKLGRLAFFVWNKPSLSSADA